MNEKPNIFAQKNICWLLILELRWGWKKWRLRTEVLLSWLTFPFPGWLSWNTVSQYQLRGRLRWTACDDSVWCFWKVYLWRGLIVTPILALNYKKCMPHLNDAFMACHVITMHSDNIRHAELRILYTATNCAFFTVSVLVTSYGTYGVRHFSRIATQ